MSVFFFYKNTICVLDSTCKSQRLSFVLLYIFSAQAVHRSSTERSIVLLYIQRHIHFCAVNLVYFTPCVRSELTPPLIYSLTIYLAASKTEKLYNRDISFPIFCFRVSSYLGPTCHGRRSGHWTGFSKHFLLQTILTFFGGASPGSFSHCGSV